MLLTARYVLPVAAPHIENGAVLVRDDKIVEIGDLEHLSARCTPTSRSGLRSRGADAGLRRPAHASRVHGDPRARRRPALLAVEAPAPPEGASVFTERGLGRLGASRRARGRLQSGITTVADITSRVPRRDAAQAGGPARVRLPRGRHDGASAGRRGHGRAREDIERVARRRRIRLASRSASLRTRRTPATRSSSERVAEYASDGTPVSMHLAGSREEYDVREVRLVDARDRRARRRTTRTPLRGCPPA